MEKKERWLLPAVSYVWPSVVVYRGATVAKRQTIIKCDWSDNFGALLEKSFFCGHVLYVLYMTSHPFIMIFIFLFSFLSLPTDPKFLRR